MGNVDRSMDGAGRPADEDTFVVPESWRKSIHPRRGGVPGPALTTIEAADDPTRTSDRAEAGDPAESADLTKEYAAERINRPRDEVDADLVRAGLAYLSGESVTPLGAGSWPPPA